MSGYLETLSRELRSTPPEPARGFAAALTAGPNVAVIAEVKRASPSQGAIAPDASIAGTASGYAKGGASAMSVLCAQRDFGGSLAHLTEARASAPLPALAKDFTLFPEQVAAQRVAGADAILVILAMVSDAEARRLVELAGLLGMDALVEVHDDGECERAVGLGARVIGVNARDLQTMVIDPDRRTPADRLAAQHRGAGGRIGDRESRRGRGRPRRRRRRGAGRHRADARPGIALTDRRGAATVSVLVKICGLTRPEDVAAAVEAGADLVGFVLEASSPRSVTPERAAQLAADVPAGVRTVAVVVSGDGPDPAITDLVQTYEPAGPLDRTIVATRGAPPCRRARRTCRCCSIWPSARRRTRPLWKHIGSGRHALPGG